MSLIVRVVPELLNHKAALRDPILCCGGTRGKGNTGLPFEKLIKETFGRIGCPWAPLIIKGMLSISRK